MFENEEQCVSDLIFILFLRSTRNVSEIDRSIAIDGLATAGLTPIYLTIGPFLCNWFEVFYDVYTANNCFKTWVSRCCICSCVRPITNTFMSLMVPLVLGVKRLWYRSLKKRQFSQQLFWLIIAGWTQVWRNWRRYLAPFHSACTIPEHWPSMEQGQNECCWLQFAPVFTWWHQNGCCEKSLLLTRCSSTSLFSGLTDWTPQWLTTAPWGTRGITRHGGPGIAG